MAMVIHSTRPIGTSTVNAIIDFSTESLLKSKTCIQGMKLKVTEDIACTYWM